MSVANEKRLIAAEIVRQLYVDGEVTQLELLKMQVDTALRHLILETKHEVATLPGSGRQTR